MGRNEKELILRTVYLEIRHDETLLKIASKLKISKSELIRRLISIGLMHLEDLRFWED